MLNSGHLQRCLVNVPPLHDRREFWMKLPKLAHIEEERRLVVYEVSFNLYLYVNYVIIVLY